jgi:alginate O-acetyltransferase complex protein AlgI
LGNASGHFFFHASSNRLFGSDVYLKRIKAEHNWWDYMLFVSFFPQIASGPISKAKDLLPQIKANRAFNYNQAVQGLKWLLWGMFIKVVVADSMGERVDIVYNDYINNGGVTCLITSFLYSFQIYCDFAGYSFMAVGVGELMGFELINNFRRPYFSMTVTEFWHRWHISLSTWLKDYIYIPLGGNRCSKIRNYWNIFITFLVSGIWHGANWTFIVWGMLHGIFQIIEKMLGLSKKKSFGVIKWIRIILAFIIVDFTWIFFRMPSLTDAIKFISHILSNFEYSFEGLPYRFLLILIVLIKDIADEYDIKKMRLMHSENVIVRWVTYLVLISFICISGVYGGQFIYSGF